MDVLTWWETSGSGREVYMLTTRILTAKKSELREKISTLQMMKLACCAAVATGTISGALAAPSAGSTRTSASTTTVFVLVCVHVLPLISESLDSVPLNSETLKTKMPAEQAWWAKNRGHGLFLYDAPFWGSRAA